MILKGKKVILRPIEREDIEFMRTLINDPNIESKIVGWAVPIASKDQENWYANYRNSNTTMRYIIEFEGQAVGFTGITDLDYKNGTGKTTGIRISPDCQSKGIATDAYMTLLKYVFYELRMNRFTGSALEFNAASLRLMEKCGYKREGLIREGAYKNGQYINVVMMGVLKSDYVQISKSYWNE